MKRLTNTQQWKRQRTANERWRRELRRKQTVKQQKVNNANSSRSVDDWSNSNGQNSNLLDNQHLKNGFRKYRKSSRTILSPPEIFCLDDNYNNVLLFLKQFRRAVKGGGRNVYMDFKKIQFVTPGAALVLAAELDRWRRIRKLRLRAVKIKTWDPSVYRIFKEMGLFDLLKVSSSPDPSSGINEVKIIKFQSIGESDLDPGRSARQFRLILEKTIEINIKDDHRKAMFKGLSEAMTNIVSHAYEDLNNHDIPIIKNAWWISGAYHVASNELSIYVYDQGIGIPRSFMTKSKWKRSYDMFKKVVLFHHDGHLIEAAMFSNRTRTELEHRGKGLRDILKWIKSSEDGELRILSGSGELRIGADGHSHVTSLSYELGGTLIHWRIRI